MKKLFILLIGASLLYSCSTSTSSNKETKPVTDGSDIGVLTDIQQNQWVKAYLEQDTVLLDKILHERYQLIDDNGDRYTKQDELTYISSYPASYSTQEYEILEIDLIENGSAIVIAKATLKGEDGAEAYITTYTSSTTFVKMDGQWSAINSHVSGVKEERFPIVEGN